MPNEYMGMVRDAVASGLSLLAAAAAAGVPLHRRAVTSWVRLADEGIEPFAGWLAEIVREDARLRELQLARLRALSERTSRKGHWAARDLERLRGAPTELGRELRELRKDARSRQARLDARKLEREMLGTVLGVSR